MIARTQPDTPLFFTCLFKDNYYFLDLACILVGRHPGQVRLYIVMETTRMAIRHQSSHHRLCNLLTLRDWDGPKTNLLAWSLSSQCLLLYVLVYLCISMDISVCPCISLYFLVYLCISLYFSVFPCISLERLMHWSMFSGVCPGCELQGLSKYFLCSSLYLN